MMDVTRPSPIPSVIDPPGVALASPCLNSSYIAAPRGSAQPITMSLRFSFRKTRGPAPPTQFSLVFSLKEAAAPPLPPAGSDRTDEAVDLAARLLPDFRTSRFVMRFRIVEIVPLVGKQHAV